MSIIAAPDRCSGCGKSLHGERVRLSIVDASGEAIPEFDVWYCCHVCLRGDLFGDEVPQSPLGQCASDSCLTWTPETGHVVR